MTRQAMLAELSHAYGCEPRLFYGMRNSVLAEAWITAYIRWGSIALTPA